MPLESRTDLLAKAIQIYRATGIEKTGQLVEALADLNLSPEDEMVVVHRIQELSHTLAEGIDAIIREASPKESLIPVEPAEKVAVIKLEKAG